MANTKKTTSTSAAAATKATTARIAAERKHTETVQAHSDAQAKLAALHQAVKQGDASITGGALAAAEQDVTRTQLIADGAGEKLAQAVAIERQAVADQAAEELPKRLDRIGKRTAQAEAQAALVKALTVLVQAVNDDNQAIHQTVADARAAGLIAGQCDPLAPVVAGRERFGVNSVRDYIEIYGTRHVEIPIVKTVEAVLGAALNATGIDLAITAR